MLLSAGGHVDGQQDQLPRFFAVIKYDQNSGQWVFSAKQWNSGTSSYICQLQTGQFKYNCIQSNSLDACCRIASVIVVIFICPGYSDRKSN